MMARWVCATLLIIALSGVCGKIAEPATEPNAYGAERKEVLTQKYDSGYWHWVTREIASTQPAEIPLSMNGLELWNTTVSPTPEQVEAAMAQTGTSLAHVLCTGNFDVWTQETTVGCLGSYSMIWMLAYTDRTDSGGGKLTLRSRVTFTIPPAPLGQVVKRAELRGTVPAVENAGPINGKPVTVKGIAPGNFQSCDDWGNLSQGYSPTAVAVAWDFTAEVAALAASGGGEIELVPGPPPAVPNSDGGQTAHTCVAWSGSHSLAITFGLPAPDERATDVAQGPPSAPPGQDECPREYVGQPINVTTGNMYLQQEEFAYPSVFGRFPLVRTYNSQSTSVGPLGLGWTHTYDYDVQEVQPGVIRVRNGAGNVRYYEPIAGSSTYRVVAPARDLSRLVRHAEGYTETEQDGLRRDFDPAGRLRVITTRAGWVTTLAYADGRLATVTDPGGRTLTFSYLGDGHLARVDGLGGLFAEYRYDGTGQLTSVADGLGTRWTFSYTATTPARLATVQDGNGNILEQHTYDDAGRVIASSQVGGVKALTLEYVDSETTRVTDSLGRVTTYTYAMFGARPAVTNVSGPCPCNRPNSAVAYDAEGRRVRYTDAAGRATQYEYDSAGNLAAVIDPLGQRSARTYDAFGHVLTATDASGATTTYTYDEATGVLRQVTDALGHATTIAPDARSLPATVTDPRGFSREITYTPSGGLATLTEPSGATTTFFYDGADRLTQRTDALGGITRYAYDARSRLVSVTDPAGAVTAFSYDAAGNRTGVTTPTGRTTVYAYDAANRLVQVTDPAGGVTRYAYDSESNLLSLTDPRGSTTGFAYDAHNRLVQRTDPLGATETFAYDENGNLATYTDRRGESQWFRYDALNRLAQKVMSGSTFTYDPVGRLLTAGNYEGTVRATYDALGRLLTTTDVDGRTLTYTYDAAGNRTGRQDETGVITTYAYDARNLLTSLSDPRVGVFTFTYDALGRRSTLGRPNETVTNTIYDPVSRLAVATHAGPAGAFESLTYSYDLAGNRVGDTRNDQARRYAYDPLDQLVQVQRETQKGRWRAEEAYTYDPVGNRLSGPATQAYTYDAASRLTSDGTATYAYDANGNLVQQVRLADGAMTSYYYDPENRLTWVGSPATIVAFRYDALGRRIERSVTQDTGGGESEEGGTEGAPPRITRYLYDAEDILATFNRRDRERARYLHGPGIDEPLAQLRPVGIRFYHADLLGTIVALTDVTGAMERRYRYDAFGVPQDHLQDPQPYRFTGREWDRDTGLYYYRARYYSPSVGRFVAEDPLGLTGHKINQYLYVMNSPLNWVDPFGLEAEVERLTRCNREAEETRQRCDSLIDKVSRGGYAACVAKAAAAGVTAGLATCDPLIGGIVFAAGGIACEIDPGLPGRVGYALCGVFAEQKYHTCVITAP